MSDRVVVSAVECIVGIGVTAEERAVRQRLSVDIEVSTDTRRAARSDSLEDAIDYGPIVAMLADLTSGREFHLIETLAEEISERVLRDFGGEAVRVVVRKHPPPLALPVGFVAVEIWRSAPGRS